MPGKRKEPLEPTGYEAGWDQEPVWMPWQRGKITVAAGNQTLAVQPIAQSLK